MTPERYSQVKSLFQLVLEQPLPQRVPFLERVCGADRDLFRSVRDLLDADASSQDFLEKPPVTPVSQILEETRREFEDTMPARVGPYAIQRQIGTGGMGAVYLALRADESYNKQVAIKVIRKGMESDRIVQRFRRERQIIASLDHPNIARLLDGGATEDGRPYIVMEYVEGQAIDVWCDQRRLRVSDRLRLFLQICDAVHYAHQNLVVHRDIKPGNIFVRSDGTVKLLDFGIAKLIGADSSTAAIDKTATSMRLMTPQYASPEQVKGDPVTTNSDVYLLGIVLYELLSGHRPYQFKESSNIEVLRAFAEGEPHPPSEAIFRVVESLTEEGATRVTRNVNSVSATRDGTPGGLLKELQGNVDAIVLKALRRNPAERYQSAAQLADDIRNHLDDEPISARPDAPAQRFARYFRRNKALVLTSIVALLLLIGIALFAGWQARRATVERQRADRRFGEVRKMANSLLFDVQDALAPLAGTTPARRLLVNKALEYLNNLSEEAAGDLGLQRELAAAFVRVGHLQGNPNFPNLGDTAGATASYQRALSLQEQILKIDPGNQQTSNDLAGTLEALADMQLTAGDTSSAADLLRRAVALRDHANAAPASKAASYLNLATVLSATGAIKEALPLAVKAHQLSLGLSGKDALRQQALSHTKVAMVFERAGQRSKAATHFHEALRLQERLAAADPVSARTRRDLSFALEDLAEFEGRAGNTAAAKGLLLRVLTLRRELFDSDPQNAQAKRDLAYALLKSGDDESALEAFRQLAERDTSNLLARRDLALAYEQQGNTALAAGQAAKAAASYENLLQAAREWVRRDTANLYANHMLAVAQMKMAEALPATGDRLGALQSAKAAVALVTTQLGKHSENILLKRDDAYARWILGRTLMECAASEKQGAFWKEAHTELSRARQMFAALVNRGLLQGEDRNAPAAIEQQIEACQKSIEALGSVAL